MDRLAMPMGWARLPGLSRCPRIMSESPVSGGLYRPERQSLHPGNPGMSLVSV